MLALFEVEFVSSVVEAVRTNEVKFGVEVTLGNPLFSLAAREFLQRLATLVFARSVNHGVVRGRWPWCGGRSAAVSSPSSSTRKEEGGLALKYLLRREAACKNWAGTRKHLPA